MHCLSTNQSIHLRTLAPLTTLRLGGPAKRLIEGTTDEEIIDVARQTDIKKSPLLVIGGGSNVVIADEGFDGTVLHIRTKGFFLNGSHLEVAAGEIFSEVVTRTVEAGLAGIECLVGIPGTIGATPIQNVGAYGQEVCDTISEVIVYDRQDYKVKTILNKDCGFQYRDSYFKKNPSRYIILRVRFILTKTDGLSLPVKYEEVARVLGIKIGQRAPIMSVYHTVLVLRTSKGMVCDHTDYDTWSVGSFFINPILSDDILPTILKKIKVRLGSNILPPTFSMGNEHTKISAAWLIEKAGFFKGYGGDKVCISSKHALALTNRGAAKTEDLLSLARTIRNGVREVFGVSLTVEPVLVGCVL